MKFSSSKIKFVIISKDHNYLKKEAAENIVDELGVDFV
jgi:hypothetical protein